MKFLLPAVLIAAHTLHGQQLDSLNKEKIRSGKKPEDKVTLSVYERIISDAKSNVRYDENIVANVKLNSWLRAEGGFRLGHRPQKFDSYYHYKLELQTKSFWNTARVIVRLADDLNQSSPIYTRSYYMGVIEVRRPLSKSFSFLAAWGQVLATQRSGSHESMPSLAGTQTNYSAYKVGLRYALNQKGYVEAMCGNYDVFNPYPPANSFLQAHFEYDLLGRTSFFTNLRYQFDKTLDKKLNNFLIVGVRIHIPGK